MVRFPGLILAYIAIFLPPMQAQCVDCAKRIWKTECDTNVTGYYCDPGAIVEENTMPEEDFKTSTVQVGHVNMYTECVPYPYTLDFVKHFCCFWSRRIGCQVALHPQVHDFENPAKYCDKCRMKCKCNNGVLLQSWHWSSLCCLSMLLSRFFSIILN